MRHLVRISLFAALIPAAFALTGCQTSSLVSESQEVSIGRQASRDIERQYKVVTDPQINQRVNRIGQALAARSGRPDLQYTFKVLDVKEVNAVSLPGGWIYVYRGLLDQVKGDDDMLAGVIAHEIGHVAARHHAQLMGRAQLYDVGVSVLTSGNVTRLAAIWANLDLLRWSRGHEYEADKLGVKYTYGSPWDPEGLIRFLGVLQQGSKSGSSGFTAMLRTHPMADDRVTRARQYLASLKAGRG